MIWLLRVQIERLVTVGAITADALRDVCVFVPTGGLFCPL